MSRWMSRASGFILAMAAWAAGGFSPAHADMRVSPWIYRAYQTEEGLPDNSITGIAQTADGYLWVATRNGLMGYNGQKFFPLPLPNAASLPSRAVRAMFQDHRDQIWLAMERGPVLCLRREGMDSFTASNGLPSAQSTVVQMTDDAAGAVWIIYSSGQLRRILHGTVQTIDLPDTWVEPGDLVVTSDAQGAIWCAKGRQLAVWREGVWRLLPSFNSPVRAILSGGKSKLWAVAGDSLFALQEGQVPERVAPLSSRSVPKVLLADRAGGIWMGTFESGLFHWDGQHVQSVPTSQHSINCLFEDREGNIWAGTEGGGLNQIRPRTAELVGREAGLPFEAAQSVAEDAAGGLWVVGQSGQLVRVKENRWEPMSDGTNWPGRTATCVAADARGGVWVGTSDQGLKYYQDGTWREWRQADGLASDTIRSLMISTNGDVWVASFRPNQLQRLRDGKVQLMHHTQPLGVIRALAETADGTIWLGTAEGQILQVSGSTLATNPAILEPFPMAVRSLLATADGSLWIGYAGDGLGRYNRGRYQRLTTADGLLDDFISQMLADDLGNLWINGDRGLTRICLTDLDSFWTGRLPKLNPQAFGRRDGLTPMRPSRDFCPSATKTHAGQLVFAVFSGLLAVQPDSVRNNRQLPPVLLERVSVDDHVVASYNAGSPLQTHSATTVLDLHDPKTTLHLGPGHRKLDIDFAALSYASPESVRYRYRLSRFDADWVEAGPGHRATYPRLSAGNYEFRVSACNNSGVWNETGATLALSVSPFFWETWWFKISGGVLTLAGLAGGVTLVARRRYRRKLRQLEARRALEQERTRIARDIHDDLGASLTRISLLSQPAWGGAEDLEMAASNLAQIYHTARDLTNAMGEVVWAVNPAHDTFDSLANYLSQYAQSFLRLARIRCRLEMPMLLPKRPVSAEVRHNLFLAFKEALNNVVKYAAATEVQIVLIPGDSSFELRVTDNGRGFSAGTQEPASPGQALPDATLGHGLGNMRRRLEEIGGRCELQTEPGRGTRLSFHVHLKPSHEPT